MKKLPPDYKRIYQEIIQEDYPEKIEKCKDIIRKRELSALDIKKLNQIIFNQPENKNVFNGRHSSYDKNAIFEILDYQKKNNCSNIQLSKHFGLSRNTITKWKKIW